METEMRFAAMRDAVAFALSSLAAGDRFAVLGFHDSVLARYPGSGLVQATSVAVAEAKEWLWQLEATKQTDRRYTMALNTTFDLLEQTEVRAGDDSARHRCGVHTSLRTAFRTRARHQCRVKI